MNHLKAILELNRAMLPKRDVMAKLVHVDSVGGRFQDAMRRYAANHAKMQFLVAQQRKA